MTFETFCTATWPLGRHDRESFDVTAEIPCQWLSPWVSPATPSCDWREPWITNTTSVALSSSHRTPSTVTAAAVGRRQLSPSRVPLGAAVRARAAQCHCQWHWRGSGSGIRQRSRSHCWSALASREASSTSFPVDRYSHPIISQPTARAKAPPFLALTRKSSLTLLPPFRPSSYSLSPRSSLYRLDLVGILLTLCTRYTP